MQHSATQCNTVQHSATHSNRVMLPTSFPRTRALITCTATHCNTLQQLLASCCRRPSHCDTLQHTATHCNTRHPSHEQELSSRAMCTCCCPIHYRDVPSNCSAGSPPLHEIAYRLRHGGARALTLRARASPRPLHARSAAFFFGERKSRRERERMRE